MPSFFSMLLSTLYFREMQRGNLRDGAQELKGALKETSSRARV
jgi:hypothetical protein